VKFFLRQIERGVEYAILKEVIDSGLSPDKFSFLNPPDEAGWLAAIDAHNGTFVEVFGMGAPNARKEVKSGHIVVEFNYAEQGTIGLGNESEYVETTGNSNPADKRYTRQFNGETTSDLEFEIRMFANNATAYRELTQVIMNVFGNMSRSFINGVNDDGSFMSDGFWVFQDGVPLAPENPEYIERMYRFVVMDIVLNKPRVITENIHPITEISVEIGPSKEDEIEDLKDADISEFEKTVIN